MATEGAQVSICSRDSASVEAAVKKLTDETGAEILGMACDVTKAESINAWVDATVAKWGVIDALLVNAGGPPGGLLLDMTDAQWQAAFELTLMSSLRMIARRFHT